MKTIVTRGIVLARTNFQEADRIVTILTPDQGKIRLMAKGVRRPKSKLAGGIELFSVGEITFMPGKGELGTLISARLEHNFSQIVKDINRTMYGYDVLKRINKITEEVAEEEYFELLQTCLMALDDLSVSLDLVDLWLNMQLLKLTGHMPNLRTDTGGNKLAADEQYVFSFDDMAFVAVPQAEPGAEALADARFIKLLRLSAGAGSPMLLAQVKDAVSLIAEAARLVKGMTRLYLPS